MNRADLLHDAFLLAETHLDYSIAMNLTSYLMNEDAYQPWVVAMEWFGQMNRLLEGTSILSRFQVTTGRITLDFLLSHAFLSSIPSRTRGIW